MEKNFLWKHHANKAQLNTPSVYLLHVICVLLIYVYTPPTHTHTVYVLVYHIIKTKAVLRLFVVVFLPSILKGAENQVECITLFYSSPEFQVILWLKCWCSASLSIPLSNLLTHPLAIPCLPPPQCRLFFICSSR